MPASSLFGLNKLIALTPECLSAHLDQSVHFYNSLDLELIVRNFQKGATLHLNGKEKDYLF